MIATKKISDRKEANVNLLAGDSGADESLWAYRNESMNTFTSHWKLTWKERVSVLFGGSIWLSLMGQGHPPVRLDTNQPDELLNT